ncbi:MAG: cysteine desulfurase family protein [Bacillota bacterium]|nr:cysteine desulfurase family protein [Bacillota bacterium]
MIYLDNSATTKQYDEVTEAMLRFMKQDFGNPSALYQLGIDAEKAIKNARGQVLDAAGPGGNRDVVFTSGGTEADNMAIFGAVESLKRQGNRIVTTEVEHPAVLECCSRLEKEGFEVVRVGVDRQCRLNMEQLENAINDRTILVTMMHVNNEVGTIMPVDKVREIMKHKGAPGLFHCDAVQSFGKLPLPGDADLISLSGHKIHGPKGSGALIISKGKTAAGRNINIPAYIVGGGQESGRRSGTENVPAIIGLGTAAEMSSREDADSFRALRERLAEGLKEKIEDIEINTPMDESCPSVLSISFRGTRGEVLLHTLEQDEIFVSTGSACSSNKKGQSHVLMAMGLKDKEIEGTLRFSLGRFNTEEDIDTAIEKTAEAVKRFRRLGSFR